MHDQRCDDNRVRHEATFRAYCSCRLAEFLPVSLQTERRFNVQTQWPQVLNTVSWAMKAAEGGGAVLVELEPGGSGREVSGRPSR
jgi:hypothetical protein